MSSLSRAYIELSNSFKSLGLARSNAPAEPPQPGTTSAKPEVPPKPEVPLKDHLKHASSVTTAISRAIKSATNRMRGTSNAANANVSETDKKRTQLIVSTLNKRATDTADPWENPEFLKRFFGYFEADETGVLSQVCSTWKDLLYSGQHWSRLTPVYDCRFWAGNSHGRAEFLHSIEIRGFDSLTIQRASDSDAHELVNNFPYCKSNICSLFIRDSLITDAGLQLLMTNLEAVISLSILGCNDISEGAFWTALQERIISFSISDCINVADDSVNAITRKTPHLQELNLQAYHVTDVGLSFLDKQRQNLSTLRLQSCWEISNQGLLYILDAMPHLTVLSLTGCTKVTDDGIEVLTDHLKNLRVLDLSWCFRVTDSGVECIACDLEQLEELNLDR